MVYCFLFEHLFQIYVFTLEGAVAVT